jgi:hypothetical protein
VFHSPVFQASWKRLRQLPPAAARHIIAQLVRIVRSLGFGPDSVGSRGHARWRGWRYEKHHICGCRELQCVVCGAMASCLASSMWVTYMG